MPINAKKSVVKLYPDFSKAYKLQSLKILGFWYHTRISVMWFFDGDYWILSACYKQFLKGWSDKYPFSLFHAHNTKIFINYLITHKMVLQIILLVNYLCKHMYFWEFLQSHTCGKQHFWHGWGYLIGKIFCAETI